MDAVNATSVLTLRFFSSFSLCALVDTIVITGVVSTSTSFFFEGAGADYHLQEKIRYIV